MHVYLALNVSVCFHVNSPMHVHVEDRGRCQHDFISHCSPYFLSIALLSLELTISARLAGQQILGFYLAIPPRLWGYKPFPPCLASYMNNRNLNSALFTCFTYPPESCPQLRHQLCRWKSSHQDRGVFCFKDGYF